MRNMTKMLCLLVLGLSLASTTGCTRVTAGKIRRNMTPELATTTRPSQLHKNDLARVRDTNLRGAWDDLDRFLLMHRTSRLTPWPVP
jgi:hypothetical protein